MSKCPHCGKVIDFMEITHDEDLLAVIKMLNTFGRHSNLVTAYTELFGLTPLKNKTKKWRVLLEDMKKLFDSESFSFQKKAYRISQTGIVEALNIVVHRNFTDGLDSHNYLKKIMVGIAEREEKDGSRRADADTRKRENQQRAGIDDGRKAPNAPQSDDPELRFSRESNLTRVRDIIQSIGGKNERN